MNGQHCASLLLLLLCSFQIDAASVQSTDTDPATVQFKVITIKECRPKKTDLVKINSIDYEKIVTYPGSLKINASVTVKSQLPSDWDVEVSVKIKMPYVGWMQMPCIENDCVLQKICSNKTIMDKCEQLFKLNDRTKMAKEYCRCDMPGGLYMFPTMMLPLESRNSGRFKNIMGANFAGATKGAEIMINANFVSSKNKQRFACFGTILEII